MNNKYKKGFSLAELMISMLVVSVVLAATIPTVTQQTASNASKFEFSTDSKSLQTNNPGTNLTLGINKDSDFMGGIAKNTTGLNDISVDGDKLSIVTKSKTNNNFANAPIAFYTMTEGAITQNDFEYGGRIAADANNIAFGIGNLNSQQNTAKNNVALGHYSLLNNYSGSDNIAIGMDALRGQKTTENSDRLTGSNNIAIGSSSLLLNSSGNNNIAIGKNALYKNMSGEQNISIGTNSGINNTTAKWNTYIGSNSGSLNKTGERNTYIGAHTGKKQLGQCNTAIGAFSFFGTENGYDNQDFTGTHNVALGQYSLFSNVNGNYNAAIGSHSLNDNLSGRSNVALGYSSMYKNRAGNSNTAVGFQSLYYNENGENNIALGNNAGMNEKGSNKLYIGIGDSPIIKGDNINKSNSANVSDFSSTLTLNAKTTILSGDLSVSGKVTATDAVSAKSVTVTEAVSAKNITATETVSAKNANVTETATAKNLKASNAAYMNAINPYSGSWIDVNSTVFRVVNGGNTVIKVNGSAFYYNGKEVQVKLISDARLKNVKGDSNVGLKEINALKIKDYTYKNDKNKTPHFGVIAQELKKVFPNSVTKGENGFYQISTEDITFALVNSVKELFTKIQNLTAKITGLDKRITELEKQNQLLMKQNEEIKAQNSRIEKRLLMLEKSK